MYKAEETEKNQFFLSYFLLSQNAKNVLLYESGWIVLQQRTQPNYPEIRVLGVMALKAFGRERVREITELVKVVSQQ